MAWTRAAPGLLALGVALVVLSGGSSADPRTPAALPGLPAPFLGTGVVGDGGLTAAIDAYGDVVDLRTPGPAGRALIENPAARQAAGSVPADTGIVPRVSIDGGAAMPMWRADSVSQRYLPGTNVLRTVARFGRVRVSITDAAAAKGLARIVMVSASAGTAASPSLGLHLEAGASVRCRRARGSERIELICSRAGVTFVGDGGAGAGGAARASLPALAPAGDAERIVHAAEAADRGWIARARPLAPTAPVWARRMYRRSLLTLRALTDRRTGAVAAGARDGWAYVWPRDAGAVALAFASAGYRGEARRIARFLLGLDLRAAARFDDRGEPVPGRGAEGDACGWVLAAARTAGLTPGQEKQQRPDRRSSLTGRCPPRDERRPDYQEGEPGDYLGNAIASPRGVSDFMHRYGSKKSDTSGRRGQRRARRKPGALVRRFSDERGLLRQAGDPASGLDSAAAWAVRPFPHPALYPLVRRTLLSLGRRSGRFGILPSEDWSGGPDPWTAPTAWSAWSLAALGERRQALRLLAALRRAATPAGELPERVGIATGLPRSTTPLAWSHAFAILALRQLWPGAKERS